jgi:hypothetical protein
MTVVDTRRTNRTFGYGVVELVLVLFLTITRIYWKFSQTVKSDFCDNLG